MRPHWITVAGIVAGVAYFFFSTRGMPAWTRAGIIIFFVAVALSLPYLGSRLRH
jgi:hypothetical protein